MKRGRLVWRGMQHYWRIYLCMGLGVALTASLVTGSLILGASLETGLRSQAEARLGKVHWGIQRQGGSFRVALAGEVAQTSQVEASALLRYSAVAHSPDESFGPTAVQLLGAAGDYPGLGGPIPEGEAIINQRAAEVMSLQSGDELILRLEQSNGPTGERPMANPSEELRPLRVRVGVLQAAPSSFDFALHRMVPDAANVWVDRAWLGYQIGLPDEANLILIFNATDETELTAAIEDNWTLNDMGFRLVDLGDEAQLESEQVVLSEATVKGLRTLGLPHVEIFSWFAFGFRSLEKLSPYGFVSARSDPTDRDMEDDAIVINQWLADDLGVSVGDDLTLVYPDFSKGNPPLSSEELFRVTKILPMQGLGADAALMPAFPGFSGFDNCREWKPGVAIDPGKIRPKDEAYWDQYHGAPKAFVSMNAAESMWRNPYGLRTAIRFDKTHQERVSKALPKALRAHDFGYAFSDLRGHHLAASVPANDLGQLFLGFAFLLIASALLLSGMLFGFVLLSRARQIRTLEAIGWTKKDIRRLLLSESTCVALISALLGASLGLPIAKLLLSGLDSFWRGAIGSAPLGYQAGLAHWLIGVVSALLLAWLVSRVVFRRMAGGARSLRARSPSGLGGLVVCLSLLGFVVSYMSLGGLKEPLGAFVSGLLLLPFGFGLCQVWLRRRSGRGDALPRSIVGLSGRYLVRRPGRSLAVIILSALGTFLVLAVGANQKDPLAAAGERSSGTGGFALFGESTLPIHASEVTASRFVPFRKKAGDDASCLNMGNAQNPSILGVDPYRLMERGAFGVKDRMETDEESVWAMLDRDDDGPIPVIGDEATLRWGLKKAVGDELRLRVEGGGTAVLKVVAMLSTNLLQGHLIIGEEHFKKLYPNQSGYRLFLIDAASDEVSRLHRGLDKRLGDFGLHIKPAWERLAQFHEVENTYLDIFQALGSLGMMLGILGLAILLLFNVIDRRSDLSILWALGFRRGRIALLLVIEHVLLMLVGLSIGLGAAAVAIWPAVVSPGAPVPYDALVYSMLLILVAGTLSTVFAAFWALRKIDLTTSTSA